jgi:hypothetical protein
MRSIHIKREDEKKRKRGKEKENLKITSGTTVHEMFCYAIL